MYSESSDNHAEYIDFLNIRMFGSLRISTFRLWQERSTLSSKVTGYDFIRAGDDCSHSTHAAAPSHAVSLSLADCS